MLCPAEMVEAEHDYDVKPAIISEPGVSEIQFIGKSQA